MPEKEQPVILLVGEDEENLLDLKKSLLFQDFTPEIFNYNHSLKDQISLLCPKALVLEDVGEKVNVAIREINKYDPDIIMVVVSPRKVTTLESEINSDQIYVKKTNPRLIELIKIGADRYIDSFNPYLVGADIRSILRMVEPPAGRVVTVGNLKVDLIKRRASLGGINLSLSRQEWLLLKLFADHFGSILTYEQLIDLWHPDFEVSLTYLRVAISRLRRKIEVNPEKPEKIHSVVGVGYIFKGPDQIGALG